MYARFPEKKGSVYVVFGEKQLLYIGVSVGRSIGFRLSTHFPEKRNKDKFSETGWTEKPYFVKVFSFPKETWFEAPGLELYLIEKLQPVDNTRGVN